MVKNAEKTVEKTIEEPDEILKLKKKPTKPKAKPAKTNTKPAKTKAKPVKDMEAAGFMAYREMAISQLRLSGLPEEMLQAMLKKHWVRFSTEEKKPFLELAAKLTQ